jgi:penicillin-binding protein 1A
MDAPIVYDDSGQEKIWRPENSEKSFSGPTRLREALVHSRNLVTVRVVRQLGVDTAISYAAKFGFNPDDMPKDMTIALGSLPATPLQMATAYAVFANGGYRVDSYFLDRIEDGSGQVVYQAKPTVVCDSCDAATAASAPVTVDAAATADSAPAAPPPAAAASVSAELDAAPPNPLPPLTSPALIAPRVISPQNLWIMDDMMADVITRGTGIRAGMALHRKDISGKTGTTNDVKDTWFNGFNRNIVASVWVGFDLERPLGEGEEGSRTAVPIWVNFMREALRAQPDRARPLPPGLVSLRISPKTGALAEANDADAIYETFMEDHLPPAAGTGNAAPGSGQQSLPGNGEPLF